MNIYRIKSGKPYKIIKCKIGVGNLTRIKIVSECRKTVKALQIWLVIFSVQCIYRETPNTFPKASSYTCSQASTLQGKKWSYLVPLSQVKETSWLLCSLNVDPFNSLFDIIQEGLALWRVFVLRVVVHIS